MAIRYQSPGDPHILALSHLDFQGWENGITAVTPTKRPHQVQDNA